MANANGNSSSRQTRRSKDYYLSGGDLYFLVDEVYFRVHRYFFLRENPEFISGLRKADASWREGEGTSESTAYILDDTSASAFEKLLWVFYNPTFSLYDAPLDDWIVIINLAMLWSFTEVKALAFREIEKIDMELVDRIELYQRLKVDYAVLVPLYAKLCEREEMLTTEESVQLGLGTVIRIFQARERLRSGMRSGMKSPLPDNVGQEEVMEVVSDVFNLRNTSECSDYVP
ncbi:hypothetical protein BDZ89DRAFT_776505 [Hymenopellis radicata]|nr:hypothetical protein BDZ89DRAFT_776505 [Hymenopellis radicata]